MRTTLNLDDDVYEAARSLAETQRESIGRVLSRLARRGLAPRAHGNRRKAGFPVVRLPPDSPPVTSESVRRALEED